MRAPKLKTTLSEGEILRRIMESFLDLSAGGPNVSLGFVGRSSYLTEQGLPHQVEHAHGSLASPDGRPEKGREA